MDIFIFQVRCFLEVTKTLSFKKAADSLYISSASMSRNIKELEELLGFPLFHRNAKNVKLTESGRIMLEGIQTLLENYESFFNVARKVSRDDASVIKIGLSPGFMPDALPNAINNFMHANENIVIQYSAGALPGVRQRFLDGLIDIVIGDGDDLALKGTDHMPLPGYNLGMCISTMHPLARTGRRLSLKDFERDTFVTLPIENSPAYANLLKQCAAYGFVPKHVFAEQNR